MADPKIHQEKINRLTKYIDGLTVRLNSGKFGPKHERNPEVYRDWLRLEIRKHTKKLEKLRA